MKKSVLKIATKRWMQKVRMQNQNFKKMVKSGIKITAP